MAADTVYESTVPWNPQRPDTVIISCVDGRWRESIQEFTINHLKADLHADFLAVPGGIEPLTLFDLVPKDFNFFRRRLEALVEAHGTRRIIAIAHQDCVWYKERKILPIRIDLRGRQIADLQRVAARLRETLPDLTIETYFARLEGKDPQRVVFEAV
jgi:carbonic anhydrase-like protein